MSNLGREEFKEFRLTAIAGLPSEEAVLREFAVRHGCSYTCDPTTLADRKYDLVLEAAHPDAVKQYAPMILLQPPILHGVSERVEDPWHLPATADLGEDSGPQEPPNPLIDAKNGRHVPDR